VLKRHLRLAGRAPFSSREDALSIEASSYTDRMGTRCTADAHQVSIRCKARDTTFRCGGGRL